MRSGTGGGGISDFRRLEGGVVVGMGCGAGADVGVEVGVGRFSGT